MYRLDTVEAQLRADERAGTIEEWEHWINKTNGFILARYMGDNLLRMFESKVDQHRYPEAIRYATVHDMIETALADMGHFDARE